MKTTTQQINETQPNWGKLKPDFALSLCEQWSGGALEARGRNSPWRRVGRVVFYAPGMVGELISSSFSSSWQVDGELEALLENGEGLSDKNQVLSLSRLMVRIETLEQKLTCLKLIQVGSSQLSGEGSLVQGARFRAF